MPGRWSKSANIIAPIAVAVVVIAIALAWRSSVADDRPEATRIGDEPTLEPAHEVTYEIWGTGTANEDVRIGYLAGDGREREATAPGVAPFWKETVTTERGLYFASVNATGFSSDLAFKLTCRITVDGVEVSDSTGPGLCTSQFEFSELADAKARASAEPTVTATTAAPKPPPPPVSCKYVSAAEMTEIVTRAAGTVKPVLGVSGTKNRCSHVIDQDASAVSFEVKRNAAAGGPQLGERVSGIKERAYWMGYSEQMGTLRVQTRGGDEFVVDVFFLALRADAKQIAVATYKAARPRLPG